MAIAGAAREWERRDPVHAGVIPLGAGLLFAALATDMAYLSTYLVQWETFSVWLIAGGLLVSVLAGAALVFDVATRRTRRIAPLKFVILASAVAVSIVNVLVHSRDGFTAVAPTGVALSSAAAVLLALAAWGGWSLNAPLASRAR